MVDQTVTTVALLGKFPKASYLHLPLHVRGQVVPPDALHSCCWDTQAFTADPTTQQSPEHSAFCMPVTGEISATGG